MAPSLASLFLLQACGLALADGLQPHLCAPRRRNHPSDVRMDLAAIHRVVAVGEEQVLLKVVYDTECTEGSSTLPCVAFLSGADCPHESYMWLATRLARAGCAVALSTSVVSFGASTCLLSVPFDMGALATIDAYRENPSRDGIAAVFDELRALNNAAGGPLFGKLDLARRAVGGHSSGGRTALDLAAFDNPFGLGAVFSYGASLVNSGFVEFAPRGSILPCDARAPPPLLLLGGSEDGISAALSQSGDATETVRRTLSEGVAKGVGCAELCVVRGANHMVACEPADPTCPAGRADRPMAPGTDGEEVRALLGSLIVDFLAAHGVLEKDVGVDERETTVRPALLHTVDTSLASPRGPSASVAFASRLLEARAHEEGGAEGEAIRNGGGGGGGDESAADARAWAVLSAAIGRHTEAIRAELRLEPSDFAAEASEWASDGLSGSIDGFASPSAVWAVCYANAGSVKGTRTQSVGFNVILTPSLPAPHLTLYVGVRAGRATVMADHLMRYDPAERPEHVAAFYLGEAAARWSALQRRAGLTSFRSSDASVRALQGPNAIALTGLVDDDDAVAALVEVLDTHVSTWLRWVKQTPLTATEAEAAAIEARDRSVRRTLCEHERAAGEAVMPTDVAASLALAMAGPQLDPIDPPRRAEPVAWRPAEEAGSLDAELIEFVAAAQFEVACLSPVAGGADGAEDDAGSDGSAALIVDVTLHPDLGSFMASKPSLTATDDGRQWRVGVHAFLEPAWREFERPLPAAPGGVYTYRREVTPAEVNAKEETGHVGDRDEGVDTCESLVRPTLCLKLKRREAIQAALAGRHDGEAAGAEQSDAPADQRAAARVNCLACRWAATRAVGSASLDAVEVEMGDDRELFDAPDGPFGNKGGLYIESRIRTSELAKADKERRQRVRVVSPTITTPLAGVPEPFLAGHYMKVLCPLAGGGLARELVALAPDSDSMV